MTGPMYDDLAELATYLTGTPVDRELDGRGCFSRDSTGEVEQIVIEMATRDVAEWDMPDLRPVTCRYDDRWRLASCMQKAIRFGMPDVAMAAANGLYTADKAWAVERLGVIAVEDVMAGSPTVVMRALAMMGQADWRRKMGERKVVVWLAGEAAKAPKDRSAVELHVLVDHSRKLDVARLARMSDVDLMGVADDHEQDVLHRQAAAQLLAGPRFASDRMPKVSSREPGMLFALMAKRGMSRWGLYVAAKTASRLRDGMWLSMLLIDEWLQRGEYDVLPGPEFEKPMVGDVLGAAYDKYTRPGLKAIDRFVKETPDVERLMRLVQPQQKRYAAGVGVFLAEGGTLARRAVYGHECQMVHEWARSPERMYWLSPQYAEEFVPTVRMNLPALNAIRAEVVGWTQEALWSGTP